MDEIAAFWYFLDYGENIIRPETKIVFKLILLTGQRTCEILWAPWEDFDFENKMWNMNEHKTKHKTGLVHNVPLSDMAQNFFLRLKAMGHPTATILLEKNDRDCVKTQIKSVYILNFIKKRALAKILR